jgi:hypothetical protein
MPEASVTKKKFYKTWHQKIVGNTKTYLVVLNMELVTTIDKQKLKA